MQNTDDTIDLTLLTSDRDEFILRCQRIVIIVVKYFIKRGMFTSAQFHDVVQSVNEEFIKRLPNIEENFDHSVRMTTYVNVVIRNICLRIYERDRTEFSTVSLSTIDPAYDDGHNNRFIVNDEIDRLDRALTLFGSQKHKLILCFKVFFRLPLTMDDITKGLPNIDGADQQLVFSAFNKNYDDTLELDVFNTLSPWMNLEENNLTTGDSLRRRTGEQLKKLIALLNGDPPLRSHTKETVKILFEHYSS